MKGIVPLVLVVLVAEIAIWVGVAQFVSAWYIFFWTILAIVLGLHVIRRSMAGVMPQMQQMQKTMQVDASPQMSHAFSGAIAGLLLLVPGLMSDFFAALMFIPAVRNKVQRGLTEAMAKRQQAMMQQMMQGMGAANLNEPNEQGFNPDMMAELMRNMGMGQQNMGQNRSNVIDGEARQVNPEVKKITAANDD